VNEPSIPAGALPAPADAMDKLYEVARPLAQRAKRGDPTVADEITALFDRSTEKERRHLSTWFAGDARKNAEFGLTEVFLKGDPVAQHATRERMAVLRKDLAGEKPTPIETLLAERIAYLWGSLFMAENALATLYRGDVTIRQYEQRARHVERLNRQFLAAIRTLAAVRRPAGPRIDVRVEGNSVTVGNAPVSDQGGPNLTEILAGRSLPRN
jgi:hypothetical protein